MPAPDGRRERNPLSALSQWKMFDNLRRSLVPAALMLLLLLGWTRAARSAGSGPRWSSRSCWCPRSPRALTDLLRKPTEAPFEQHIVAVVAHARKRQFAQALLALACLPYEAFYSLDAIVRTLWRMLISHRRLLEWKPSSDRRARSLKQRTAPIWPASIARCGSRLRSRR